MELRLPKTAPRWAKLKQNAVAILAQGVSAQSFPATSCQHSQIVSPKAHALAFSLCLGPCSQLGPTIIAYCSPPRLCFSELLLSTRPNTTLASARLLPRAPLWRGSSYPVLPCPSLGGASAQVIAHSPPPRDGMAGAGRTPRGLHPYGPFPKL